MFIVYFIGRYLLSIFIKDSLYVEYILFKCSWTKKTAPWSVIVSTLIIIWNLVINYNNTLNHHVNESTILSRAHNILLVLNI